ncbi:YafY family transcriptional regulator [Shimia sp. R11_0]|uniref:helix-turn-helix transcriptional regulator n=1 Tax=Shimia sp. R11_0 TaxID=2821096 RepID=UPI001ADBE135|nr:YafY family protein [Shimia sp. R11_0]MBO9476233.1 YafY family transcriptional regulator [Shimia sp. R11_0]
MRRTDRLFELIQCLRDGRLHTASALAEQMEVSVRTIYRDMDTLVASGIPVEGERGVGYILRAPVFMTPMSLTQVELEALHLGAALVRQTADAELQQAAARVLTKVDQAMPEPMSGTQDGFGKEIFAAPAVAASFANMPILRQAIREQEVLLIAYDTLDGRHSRRHIRPLQMEYWGRAWTCTAWCELRADFRVFRIDNIQTILRTNRRFEITAETSLSRYMERFASE